jgi:hypothetical protein
MTGFALVFLIVTGRGTPHSAFGGADGQAEKTARIEVRCGIANAPLENVVTAQARTSQFAPLANHGLG